MRNFKDKVVVITGAGSGIGRSLAIQFANLGCHLAIADNSMDTLQETEKLITNITTNYSVHHLDVSNKIEVQLFVDQVIDAHSKVHILINNAGVTLLDRIEYGNIDEFMWLMNINFYGVIYGVAMFLPYLKNANEAHIVNISSVFGIMAMPGQAAYNSSKFAVRGFTEALRMELCDTSVNVSCVHPGGIKTSIAKNARRAPGITASTKIDVIKEFNHQARKTRNAF
jgi:NADP-dependent 3-hydroxy acid dehydrogenase YdfG